MGGYVFRADKEHIEYWQNHALPVVICLCDVDKHIIYWQVVNAETAESTGKGCKLVVPWNQTINMQSAEALHSILTPIVAKDKYTIFRTEDNSHGAAKRYSFEAVLNRSATKAEVAAIVRQITNEGAKRRYHRNHLVEGRWGESDAHVVWTFVYPSAEDHNRRNYICRSIWIRDGLGAQFRPMGFDGENVGDNIIVDWSTNYNALAEHVSSRTLSKEDYFSRVLPLVAELKESLTVIQRAALALSEKQTDEASFLAVTESSRERINEIYTDLTGLSFAPFECRDMDVKLQSFAAYLHNVWLFYSRDGSKTWDADSRLHQSLQQLAHAREGLGHLEYELSKVR